MKKQFHPLLLLLLLITGCAAPGPTKITVATTPAPPPPVPPGVEVKLAPRPKTVTYTRPAPLAKTRSVGPAAPAPLPALADQVTVHNYGWGFGGPPLGFPGDVIPLTARLRNLCQVGDAMVFDSVTLEIQRHDGTENVANIIEAPIAVPPMPGTGTVIYPLLLRDSDRSVTIYATMHGRDVSQTVGSSRVAGHNIQVERPLTVAVSNGLVHVRFRTFTNATARLETATHLGDALAWQSADAIPPFNPIIMVDRTYPLEARRFFRLTAEP